MLLSKSSMPHVAERTCATQPVNLYPGLAVGVGGVNMEPYVQYVGTVVELPS